MNQIQIVFEPKNRDTEHVTRMKIIREINKKVEVSARYFFPFGMRIGLVIHYE